VGEGILRVGRDGFGEELLRAEGIEPAETLDAFGVEAGRFRVRVGYEGGFGSALSYIFPVGCAKQIVDGFADERGKLGCASVSG